MTAKAHYRSATDIDAEILRIASKPKPLTKTRIMWGAYMAYGQTNLHLAYLIERGLLLHVEPYYRTTPRGLDWLSHYDAMRACENFHKETVEVPGKEQRS